MSDETKQFPCDQCGGKLSFTPGTASLTCEYCGFENHIPQSAEAVDELDFHSYLEHARENAVMVEQTAVTCDTCAASITLEPNISADDCPYCGAAIVTAGGSSQVIKPESLLPFHIKSDDAGQAFRDWIKALWFAPNKLKAYATVDNKLAGVYMPHWTFDCATISYYTGERGDDYYKTESYTETDSEGNTVHKTRQVRKTRWHRVSGTVWNRFDDLLVPASNSLPEKYVKALEPWDLENLVAFSEEYMSGFRAETYQIDLAQGFDKAKEDSADAIRNTIQRDIGGDHQRIHSVNTGYKNISFKHILLPVWISAYRYNNDVYRFMINARTGEVQGERPWSVVKIVSLIIFIIAIVTGLVIAVI